MRPVPTPVAVGAAVIALAALGGACTSKADSADKVAVTATDSSCDVATTELSSGTITFAVKNDGGDVTEVYVYRNGDEVMGEVENIGPGTSRDLTVELGAGTYEVACKPGQTGDGIRTEITVSGTATTEAAAGRTVAVEGYDYAYEGMADFSAAVGETVEFDLTNTATDTQHEMEILGPDGVALGEVGPTDPGATGSVTVTFSKPGTYTYVCGIDDHEAEGMKGEFTVSAS